MSASCPSDPAKIHEISGEKVYLGGEKTREDGTTEMQKGSNYKKNGAEMQTGHKRNYTSSANIEAKQVLVHDYEILATHFVSFTFHCYL